MEICDLQQDIKAFGFHVKTFPMGIGETFDALMKILPPSEKRSFYGVSWFTDNGAIMYYALANEIFDGEAEKYGDHTRIIPKGKYLTIRVKDWRKKTDTIKDVFGEMMNDERSDKNKPCVEWYKTEEEMLCMMQIKTPV
jgi:hypothetical protein